MARIISRQISNVCIIDVNWNKYNENSGFIKNSFIEKLIKNVKNVKGSEPAQPTPKKSNLKEGLKGTRAEKEYILTCIQAIAAEILGYNDREIISVNKPVMEQGFDSLMIVKLRNNLNANFEAVLPITLLFNYPTIDKVTDYILDDVLAVEKNTAVELKEKSSSSAVSVDDILKEIETLV